MGDAADWERTKALFQAVLDLPEGQRREFVTARAGDDVALRDAVLRLLAQDEQTHAMLDGGVRSLPESEALALPQTVGPYRIERLLGRGGMGIVLLGTRRDGEFEQQVAIKLIRTGLFDAHVVARFRREREILARLSHPHIARLTDGGLTAHGLPWYAMEYVDGTPLGEWCDARAATLRERVELLLQVLDAVGYAHRNLVVHRDLKPSNILVTGHGPGQAKLLDFGIAKLLDEAEGPALTGSATRLLTPDYAAPEQVLGRPVSTATDVYALGVLLFESLTGRLPYRATGSGPRMATAIVDEVPARLRQAISRQTGPSEPKAPTLDELARRRGLAPAKLRAALDRDLEQIVAIALAKRPEDRYASVAAFGDDLRAWLEARPLRSRPVPWPRRAAMFVRRNRVGVAAAIAVLLVAVLGVAATIAQSVRARHEADTAQAVRRTLTELFANADPTTNGGRAPTLREVLDLGVENIAHDQALGPDVRLPLLSDLGEVYASLGGYERALAVYAQARAALAEMSVTARSGEAADTPAQTSRTVMHDVAAGIPTQTAGATSTEATAGAPPQTSGTTGGGPIDASTQAWASTLNASAQRLARARRASAQVRSHELAQLELRVAQAFTELERMDDAGAALEAARVALPEDERDARLATDIQIAAAWLDERRDAKPAAASRLEQLIARLEAARPPRTLEAAQALQVLGSVEISRDRPQAGLAYLQRSFQHKRRAGVGEVELASAQAELARAMRDVGKPTEALAPMRAAYATQARVLGAGHPLTLQTQEELAVTIDEAGLADEARAAYADALQATMQRFGNDHPRVALAANNYGVWLYGERNFEGAAAQFAQAVRIWERELGPAHDRTLQARGNLAGAWTELGRLAQARPALDTLVAARRERGAWAPLFSALLTRGLLLERVDEAGAARRDFEQALALGRDNAPDDQVQWVWAQVLTARALRRAGDLAGARALLEDALEHYQLPVYQGGGPRVSTALLELARTLSGQGQARERAVELLRRSLDIRISRLGADHPDTAEVRRELERLQTP